MFDDFVIEKYGYGKNSDGNIVFPNDRIGHTESEIIKRIKHPSANNLFMLESLCDYLGDPEGIIIDPMAGRGSIMVGRFFCLRLWMYELNPFFVGEIQKNISELRLDNVAVVESDCVAALEQLPDDYITATIFSPPYANQLQSRTGHKVYDDKDNWAGEAIRNYTYEHKRNMANMQQFQFNRVMRSFYKELYRVTKTGGRVCIIIKDRMSKGQRVPYGVEQARWAYQGGFVADEWHAREAIGSVFGYYNLQRGIKQVTDEHIIILKKE